ncbi:MAG: hypothetical protein ACK5AV_05075, partial [Alphaproteobacteria bacterium]
TQGANVDVVDENGSTAFDLARASRSYDVAQLLIQKNVIINNPEASLRYAAYHAVEYFVNYILAKHTYITMHSFICSFVIRYMLL